MPTVRKFSPVPTDAGGTPTSPWLAGIGPPHEDLWEPGPERLAGVAQPFRHFVAAVNYFPILMLDSEGPVTTWNDGAELPGAVQRALP